jgi:hypothetical protein
MLQIDHVYEFFHSILPQIEHHYFRGGVIEKSRYHIFTKFPNTAKILYYDQEPLLDNFVEFWLKVFVTHASPQDPARLIDSIEQTGEYQFTPQSPLVLTVSEHSPLVNILIEKYNVKKLYYFFHGFAALDWYRGYYALNYNNQIVKQYKHDFISFNRIISDDRSYRIYFVSKLKEQGLLDHGLISFNVTDNLFDEWQDEVNNPQSKLSHRAKQHIEKHMVDIDKLIIDHPELPGSASADILRNNYNLDIDPFWHVVTETVFYYDKLHLTEKIFKPIVSKQPFMLLAAPGNLAYLRSYGFKTFDSIIDESYDTIQDPDQRTEAVVNQLAWYCALSDREKQDMIRAAEPIILHNFHHFYGEFRHIITRELLDNTKTVFHEIGYDDGHINYHQIHHVLTH